MLLQPRIMARVGIARAKMPILRETNKQFFRGFSKFAEAGLSDDDADEQESLRGSLKVVKGDETINSKDNLVNWVPHPRSGIYVPQGHERLMDDVPNGAACFGHRTFWLRSHDGVDKGDPNNESIF